MLTCDAEPTSGSGSTAIGMDRLVADVIVISSGLLALDSPWLVSVTVRVP